MAKEKATWKWAEFDQWKEKQQPTETPEEIPVRPGRCGCGSAQFQLKIKRGQLDRICRGCGEVVENI
jgi:hypothetical protein